jgi:hypothetical protein
MHSTPTPPPTKHRRVRGWVLLVIVLVAMGGYTAAKFISAAFLDSDQERRRVARAGQLAADAREAWDGHANVAGLERRRGAEDAIERANELMAAGQYEAAHKAYQDAHERYMTAFTEHANALAGQWQEGILGPAQARVWTCYPFQADAEAEADLALVTELFNPVNGSVWQVEAAVRRLNDVEVQNMRVARLELDREWLERARIVRAALFGDSGELDVRFEVLLDADDWQLEFNGETVATGPQRLRWTAGLHSVTLRNAETELAFEGTPWAWLRLLDTLEVAVAEPGEQAYDLPGGGCLNIRPARPEHPFRRPRGL